MTENKKGNKTSTSKKKSGASVSKKKSGKTIGKPDSGKNPLYVLIILLLLTVIVFLLNLSYDRLPLKSFKPEDEYPGRKERTELLDKKDFKKVNEGLPDTTVIEKTEPLKKDEKILKPEDRYASVEVFFLKLDERTENLYLIPVVRNVSDQNVLALSLESLIAGPGSGEKASGYMTALPSNLRIRSVSVRGGTAYIDFNSAVEENASGHILIKRIQQIVYTATQFSNVDNVIITINGRRKSAIGADGLSISGPLTRQ